MKRASINEPLTTYAHEKRLAEMRALIRAKGLTEGESAKLIDNNRSVHVLSVDKISLRAYVVYSDDEGDGEWLSLLEFEDKG